MSNKLALLYSALAGSLLLASCNLTNIGAAGLRPVSVKSLPSTKNCSEIHVVSLSGNRPDRTPFIFKEPTDPGYIQMIGTGDDLTLDATCMQGSTVTGRSVLTFTVKADKPGRTPTPVDVRIASPERVEGTPSRAGYTVVEGQYAPVIIVTFPE